MYLRTSGIDYDKLVEAQTSGRIAVLMPHLIGRVRELIDIARSQQLIHRLKSLKHVSRLPVPGIDPVLIFRPLSDHVLSVIGRRSLESIRMDRTQPPSSVDGPVVGMGTLVDVKRRCVVMGVAGTGDERRDRRSVVARLQPEMGQLYPHESAVIHVDDLCTKNGELLHVTKVPSRSRRHCRRNPSILSFRKKRVSGPARGR